MWPHVADRYSFAGGATRVARVIEDLGGEVTRIGPLALGGGLRRDDPTPLSSQDSARRRALLLGLRERVPVDIYENADVTALMTTIMHPLMNRSICAKCQHYNYDRQLHPH